MRWMRRVAGIDVGCYSGLCGGLKNACNVRLLDLKDQKVKCSDDEQLTDFMIGVKPPMKVSNVTENSFDVNHIICDLIMNVLNICSSFILMDPLV